MKIPVLCGSLGVLLMWCCLPLPARAQWSLSLGVEADRFWGGSLENGPEQRSFRPYRPTVLALGLERRGEGIGFGVRARYTEASLGLEGSGAVVAAEGAFTVLGFVPEVGYGIATLGPGNRLQVHAGPIIEFWHPIDQEWRTRIGAQGTLSLAVPLGGRFGLSMSGNLAVIPSPFRSDELLDQYDRKPLWRRGYMAGLQYRM